MLSPKQSFENASVTDLYTKKQTKEQKNTSENDKAP